MEDWDGELLGSSCLDDVGNEVINRSQKVWKDIFSYFYYIVVHLSL